MFHSESTTNSYLGHRFIFVDLKNKEKIHFDFTVNEEEDIYAYVDLKTANKEKLRQHQEELVFAKDYKNRTGRHWYGYYPHLPVRNFIWPADYIGQVHKISVSNHIKNELELKVISVMPRAFLVQNFFTKEEAEEIVKATGGKLGESTVTAHDENGNRIASNTRTSKNTWLSRNQSPTLDRIFMRASELMRLNNTFFTHEPPYGMVENMQV